MSYVILFFFGLGVVTSIQFVWDLVDEVRRRRAIRRGMAFFGSLSASHGADAMVDALMARQLGLKSTKLRREDEHS